MRDALLGGWQGAEVLPSCKHETLRELLDSRQCFQQ